MTLEYKKKNTELLRVQLAREEMELKIEERLEEIERLRGFIKIQVEKEEELKLQLKTLV